MEHVTRYSDWRYRSEGNRNVVIYSKKHGRVYRVLKVDAQTREEANLISDDCIRAHYNKQIQYNACVMDRLYLDYMSVPVMKSINVQFLTKLSVDIESQRPDKRLSKSISLCPAVLDIPDYAFLPAPYRNCSIPTFMFEIKAGPVARSYGGLISEDSRSIQVPRCSLSDGYCYYCLSKSLIHKNEKKRLSRYCPQELFSGNIKRMKRCITKLFEDINCFRNKLRIFQNGIDITSTMHGAEDIRMYFSHYLSKGTGSDVLDMLSHLLLNCLTHCKPLIKRRGSLLPQLSNEKNQLFDSSSLPAGCVLSTFANAQYFGVGRLEEIQRSYDNLKAHIVRDPSIRNKLCIDGPYDTGLWRLGSRPTVPHGISNDIMTDFLVVRNYLIYRTAKDASILVTFQPNSSGVQVPVTEDIRDTVFVVTDPASYQKFNCNVTIIDLDPKPFSRMERYLNSEWKVYNASQKCQH